MQPSKFLNENDKPSLDNNEMYLSDNILEELDKRYVDKEQLIKEIRKYRRVLNITIRYEEGMDKAYSNILQLLED